jgi:hypothetical protein
MEINAMLPIVDDVVKEQPDGRLYTLCNANLSTHHTLIIIIINLFIYFC